MTIWYSIDDSERREYEIHLWNDIPITEDRAGVIAERILNRFVERNKNEYNVKLYKDGNPETRPAWIVDVQVEWEPFFNTTVLEGVGNNA